MYKYAHMCESPTPSLAFPSLVGASGGPGSNSRRALHRGALAGWRVVGPLAQLSVRILAGGSWRALGV
eukprot:14664347-Alexandrium_andersonii.AAC.1